MLILGGGGGGSWGAWGRSKLPKKIPQFRFNNKSNVEHHQFLAFTRTTVDFIPQPRHQDFSLDFWAGPFPSLLLWKDYSQLDSVRCPSARCNIIMFWHVLPSRLFPTKANALLIHRLVRLRDQQIVFNRSCWFEQLLSKTKRNGLNRQRPVLVITA